MMSTSATATRVTVPTRTPSTVSLVLSSVRRCAECTNQGVQGKCIYSNTNQDMYARL